MCACGRGLPGVEFPSATFAQHTIHRQADAPRALCSGNHCTVSERLHRPHGALALSPRSCALPVLLESPRLRRAGAASGGGGGFPERVGNRCRKPVPARSPTHSASHGQVLRGSAATWALGVDAQGSAVPVWWEHPGRRRAGRADAEDAGGASGGCEGVSQRTISRPKKFSRAEQVGGRNRGWRRAASGRRGPNWRGGACPTGSGGGCTHQPGPRKSASSGEPSQCRRVPAPQIGTWPPPRPLGPESWVAGGGRGRAGGGLSVLLRPQGHKGTPWLPMAWGGEGCRVSSEGHRVGDPGSFSLTVSGTGENRGRVQNRQAARRSGQQPRHGAARWCLLPGAACRSATFPPRVKETRVSWGSCVTGPAPAGRAPRPRPDAPLLSRGKPALLRTLLSTS